MMILIRKHYCSSGHVIRSPAVQPEPQNSQPTPNHSIQTSNPPLPLNELRTIPLPQKC